MQRTLSKKTVLLTLYCCLKSVDHLEKNLIIRKKGICLKHFFIDVLPHKKILINLEINKLLEVNAILFGETDERTIIIIFCTVTSAFLLFIL